MITNFEYMISNLQNNINVADKMNIHAIYGTKALNKSSNSNIVACAQKYYDIADHTNGERKRITKIYWKYPVISKYLSDLIYSDISSVV